MLDFFSKTDGDGFRSGSVLILIYLLLNTASAFTQEEIKWDQLARVTDLNELQPKVEVAYLKGLVGKEVVISGYYIPLEGDRISMILSMNPYNACFFCGNAGPETVIEVWLRPEAFTEFSIDQILTIKGVFDINLTETDQLPYRLFQATVRK